MARIKNNKCWQGCGEIGTLVHCWWECKMVQLLWKTVWQRLKKLNIELPYDPAIPLLGIYLKESRNIGIFIPIFKAALFTIAKWWKITQVPINRWMHKQNVMYTYNGILFTIKKNEELDFPSGLVIKNPPASASHRSLVQGDATCLGAPLSPC